MGRQNYLDRREYFAPRSNPAPTRRWLLRVGRLQSPDAGATIRFAFAAPPALPGDLLTARREPFAVPFDLMDGFRKNGRLQLGPDHECRNDGGAQIKNA